MRSLHQRARCTRNTSCWARTRGMDHHGERRSSAHGAAARPWRGTGGGGGALPPPPPKVYRVEPRDFRALVQRLTGAGGGSEAAAPGPAAQLAAQQRVVAPAMVAESRRMEAAAAAAAAAVAPEQQFDYASWYSAPLLSPAYGAAGFGGHQL
ncbi:hypothetical protein SETIT_9G141000v2 [Setaria italica]|uniref:VQ domain-containing protein n=3 Tax=Setaria TaxID=4554 RepID=A0A368SGL9_SETIT|nr:uncharacterized protein LOC101757844 [Setaria italica]XP_034575351.1 uncharacterized protein LOC117839183 [Setaria viridis]RCV41504.1 hypothetical protein SETIT_9G141000v2 [Setaria italica]